MPSIKAYSSGQWLPAIGPPGVITKSASTTAFSRGVSSVWADDDAGGWAYQVELFPSTPSASVTNNSGRVDISWTIDSTSNVDKFQIFRSFDNSTFTHHADVASNLTSYIFGRVAAPITYYFFVRALAFNGLYRDSSVVSVSVPGVTSWNTFSHSRSSSGWHTRSFTFTAGVSSTSTITNLSATLQWRENTSQAWSTVTSYSENNVTSMTKTYSFSAYTYGQRMFRVVMTATDNQTRQNDGSTGTGYQWSNAWDTSDLTAADISGGVPIISGSVGTVSDPLSPPATTSNRSLSFTVGFDANIDRSEYDSAVLILYKTSNGLEHSRHTVDLAALKTNQAIKQELTYSFSSLPAGTGYRADFNVYDDEGVDRTVSNTQTTYAEQDGSWTRVTGSATSSFPVTYHLGDSVWKGNGTEFIGDAPFGPAYTTSKAQLRDNNNDTWYVTTSMGTSASSTTYQRIRAYNYRDFSVNSSTWTPGAIGYGLNWIEFNTPQNHQIHAQVYDYKSATWLGFLYPSPSDAQYYIAVSDVNGNWRLNLSSANFEGLTTAQQPNTNNWYCDFDVRAIMTKTKVYSGATGYRVALSEIRVNTTWFSRYDTSTTTAYKY